MFLGDNEVDFLKNIYEQDTPFLFHELDKENKVVAEGIPIHFFKESEHYIHAGVCWGNTYEISEYGKMYLAAVSLIKQFVSNGFEYKFEYLIKLSISGGVRPFIIKNAEVLEDILEEATINNILEICNRNIYFFTEFGELLIKIYLNDKENKNKRRRNCE